MKALSVCQPWAWAIVTGLKTVENRSRPTRHRGPLLIHASRSRRYLGEDFADLLPGLPPADWLDFGALVGMVEVVGCVPAEEVGDDPFATGPWCWLLRDARRVCPHPFKGQVGLFHVSDPLARALLRTPRVASGESAPADKPGGLFTGQG
jgi:ASCH domain